MERKLAFFSMPSRSVSSVKPKIQQGERNEKKACFLFNAEPQRIFGKAKDTARRAQWKESLLSFQCRAKRTARQTKRHIQQSKSSKSDKKNDYK
ncbi:MAG: hypothetical protein J6M53_05900 [Bacteroidaceae bacterium]|nr:hypothetical protein [Bacteroidaceae bacterium]